MIRSLFVIVCTQIIPIATAFFIVWNFKAQSTPVPRLVQRGAKLAGPSSGSAC